MEKKCAGQESPLFAKSFQEPPEFSSDLIRGLRRKIRGYYDVYRRNFPWRETDNPYNILVSEVMLQQTQTSRVESKYLQFLEAFPDVAALDAAELTSVLRIWKGLGYNRRALVLKRIAQIVLRDFDGELPRSLDALLGLPGIGRATAGAILAFAFNEPVVFIETNIRRVFLHFFFPDREAVSDQEILPIIEQTLDRDDPRHWYYALMDYGAMLAKDGPNPNRRSAHYTRQARFTGSNRQIRGQILQLLLERSGLQDKELVEHLGVEAERVRKILDALVQEGFLKRKKGKLFLR
ncbi:MAG TPA: A/G-specific adenine glycosylase [Deltaproteobacteria bacterium]|nr:A/G-specific adenine glycosylase [Deltaproteobacteria bacterium]